MRIEALHTRGGALLGAKLYRGSQKTRRVSSREEKGDSPFLL